MPLFGLPSSQVVMHQLHYGHRVDVLRLLQVAYALQCSGKPLLAGLNGFVSRPPNLVVKHTQVQEKGQSSRIIGVNLALPLLLFPLLLSSNLVYTPPVSRLALFLQSF